MDRGHNGDLKALHCFQLLAGSNGKFFGQTYRGKKSLKLKFFGHPERKVKVKVQPLVTAPLTGKHISEALRCGTCCKGSHSFTCIPMRLSANVINHAEAGPHFIDPGGMKG